MIEYQLLSVITWVMLIFVSQWYWNLKLILKPKTQVVDAFIAVFILLIVSIWVINALFESILSDVLNCVNVRCVVASSLFELVLILAFLFVISILTAFAINKYIFSLLKLQGLERKRLKGIYPFKIFKSAFRLFVLDLLALIKSERLTFIIMAISIIVSIVFTLRIEGDLLNKVVVSLIGIDQVLFFIIKSSRKNTLA